jgi:hypothetical protein
VCPNCSAQFVATGCLDCRKQFPMSEWVVNDFAGRDVMNRGATTQS